jgi:O-antigen ligase
MPQQMSQIAETPFFASAPSSRYTYLALMCLLGSVAGCAVLGLEFLPEQMMGIETIEAFIASSILMLMLIVPMAARSRCVINARQQLLLSAMILFSMLIVAERIFYRYSTLAAAYQGSFMASAYAEAMIWAVCSVVLLFVTIRNPGYLSRLLAPSFRYLFLLALFCVASAAYSPAKAFSAAWGFKLLLSVLLLRVILDEIESMEDLRWFFRAALWSFTALVVLCGVQFLATRHPWENGRMSEALSPTGVSAIAATLFLLGLTFFVEESRAKYLVCAGLGFCTMLLSGGKGGIIAALVASTGFIILRKSFKSGLVFLAVVIVAGGLLVATTPLQKYLVDYAESGEAQTGTGRVELWKVVVPAILEKPIYGHGFMASKFIVQDEPGIDWPAGHTHNGFLEILYNNGAIGLLLLLAVLWRTVRNLLWVIRRVSAGEVRTWAIGAFALFIFEMLNGMLNASFGGRPGSAYLILLSLLVISEVLTGLVQRAIRAASTNVYGIAVGA